MTSPYDRTLTVQTLGEREGSQESCPSGKEHVIAEVKVCISSTPLVSAVNHMDTFLERKKQTTKK